MKLRNLVFGVFVVILLAGCENGIAPAPGAVPTVTKIVPTLSTGTTPIIGTVTVQPRITPGKPAFTFLPKTIQVGSNVRMTGANFTPGSTVVVRMGNPNPMGEALSSAQVDANGKWLMAFLMPATLPSGQQITSGDYEFVIMDQNNQVLTSGPFKFTKK